jgi:hypothetical protein
VITFLLQKQRSANLQCPVTRLTRRCKKSPAMCVILRIDERKWSRYRAFVKFAVRDILAPA